MDQKKSYKKTFFFLIITTNAKPWVRKTRFLINIYRKKRFRRSSWSENLAKEVIRKKMMSNIVSSDTKAPPGRTDAKIIICLQTQASCRLETSTDDYIAAVTVAVAAYRRRKQRIKIIKQLALILGFLKKKTERISTST